MNEEHHSIAQMIRNGSYFKEARKWYEALYVAPIGERSFFLVISALSAIIALLAIIAFIALMPLNRNPGVIIASERPYDLVPRLTRVKRSGAAVEPAMEQHLLRLYVEAREGYEISRYNSNYAYVIAHSDEPTGNAYATLYNSTNPQSLTSMLGYSGQRVVTVDNILIHQNATQHEATVSFTTELINVSSGNAKTRWTATLQYYYTPLTVTEEKDSAGNPILVTKDPQLQVTSYAVTQAS